MASAEEELIEAITERKKSAENKLFGEFIVQTNQVQFDLSLLILLQSSFRDKKYREYLERATIGHVVNLFCACAERSKRGRGLIKNLRDYKKQRDRLAHKMFTEEELTPKECKLTIEKGKEILKTIKIMTKEKIANIKP